MEASALARIVDIRQRTISLRSDIENAWISFRDMDTSLVAIVSDVVRGGRPVAGFGFGSNGRYAQSGLLESRFIPRLLGASPDELAGNDGAPDPVRAWDVLLRNEKPGGHGERSVAVGVLDMALWDLAAKLAGVPLYRLLATRFGDGTWEDRVFAYAAGGYYAPGRTESSLRAEMRGYLDAGYTHVKLKIGGASLAEDLRRIDAGRRRGGRRGPGRGRRERPLRPSKLPLEYAAALRPYGLWWYEEPGDPLDFEVLRAVASAYPGALATGENLFSLADVRNLLRYGGLRPDLDVIQVDPSLSYGVVEYVRILEEMARHGWSPRRCIPGGHQLTLHMAAAFRLGGNESYPGVFKPIGGFGDAARIEGGFVRLPEAPGIGIEANTELARLFAEMVET